jgi:hypothetical protein
MLVGYEWTVEKDSDGNEYEDYGVWVSGIHPVLTNAEFTGEFPEQLKNARLMAAAPDLLAACEAVLSYIASHQIYDKDARGVLEQAIAKAKGE